MRPRRFDRPVAPPPERDAATIRRTLKHLQQLEDRITEHGVTCLPEWLGANFGGLPFTDRVAALSRVMKMGELAKDTLQACRDALT